MSDLPHFLRNVMRSPIPDDTHEPHKAMPCDALPPPARDLLVLASQIVDPHERRVAIDHAIDRVKARFPELFHPHPAKE